MSRTALALRQQRLLQRSAELRSAMGTHTLPFEKPLLLADRAWWALLWLRKNPQWPVGALLLTAVLRPKRTLVWGTRLWWVWRTLQRTSLLLKR